MAEIIQTGSTVDEAVAKVCAEYNVNIDDVTVEVLEMPKAKKLFFAAKPAKVKVSFEEKVSTPAPVVVEKSVEKEEKPANFKEESLEEKPCEINAKITVAVDFLKDIAEKMGVENVEIYPVKVGETTILKVNGKNAGILIGRRGETMESLSYLVGLAANRAEGDYEKIGLDVAGYRSKRESDLQTLAKRIGEKVKKTKEAYRLEPMNAYERRVIHSAISEIEGVKSESMGEGATRRVVILSTDPDAKGFVARSPRGDRRAPSRAPRSGGNRPQNRGPRPAKRDNFSQAPRPRRQESAPVASARTTAKDDAAEFGLYGKIEL